MKTMSPRKGSRVEARRATVLRLLRRHKQLSRSEIAHRAGVSEASVSRIVSDLVRDQLVVEMGVARSTGGRPAAYLQFNNSVHHTVGVEIHSWSTRLALGTLGGGFQEAGSFPTPAEPVQTLDCIARRIADIVRRRPEITLAGVGISARGLVNCRAGLIERGDDKRWTRIPVREHLEKRLGLPVHVDNNVRCSAFAEYHYGSPDVQDAHCLLFVGVDEGIGFSMVVNGELYYGQHMAAGEFGQMVIADEKGRETHDRPGCLEQLAADGSTCERFWSTNGARRTGREDVTACVRQIAHRGLAGDPAAAAALKETARCLGLGISNVIWGLDPDVVVIDGAIADAWSLISPVIRSQFADGREFLNFRNLILRPSALRGEAAMIGAAALPFRSLFDGGELVSR